MDWVEAVGNFITFIILPCVVWLYTIVCGLQGTDEFDATEDVRQELRRLELDTMRAQAEFERVTGVSNAA